MPVLRVHHFLTPGSCIRPEAGIHTSIPLLSGRAVLPDVLSTERRHVARRRLLLLLGVTATSLARPGSTGTG